MVSVILMLYSTIVLTMNTGKYPICVCWPQAQSQANVAPCSSPEMLSHKTCQCIRVMSYARLTQTLWEGELMRLLKRETSCATLCKHHEVGLAMWDYIATRGDKSSPDLRTQNCPVTDSHTYIIGEQHLKW